MINRSLSLIEKAIFIQRRKPQRRTIKKIPRNYSKNPSNFRSGWC